MEIYERIRELRKKHLKMTMEAFGTRIGVSRDVINNIEHNRLARPDQKLSLMKLICKEFSVNEEWLLDGTGPVFVEPDTFSLDEFMKQRGSTDLELKLIKAYFEIDPEDRQKILNHFKSCLLSDSPATASPAAAPSEKDPEEMTVEEAEAIYKSSLSTAHKTGYAASSITDGTKKKEA